MKHVYAWRDGKVQEIDPRSTHDRLEDMFATSRKLHAEWYEGFMERECKRLAKELDLLPSPLLDLLKR